MTDKSDDRVGHLNTILARGGGNLNDPIFKSSNAQALPWGMLKFRVDRRIIEIEFQPELKNEREHAYRLYFCISVNLRLAPRLKFIVQSQQNFSSEGGVKSQPGLKLAM